MSTDIQALNDCYGVKDRITVVPHGRTHWPKVRLSTALGATAEILLYGGQLISWKSETGKENIFLSQTTAYTEGKAVRGGVPICFPQFATQGPLPQHGFARTSHFQIERSGTKVNNENHVTVVLGLHDDEATRKIWPHHFHLTIQIDLRSSPTDSSSLTITLGVVNENTNQPFSFSTALHTYFAVNDVEKVGIHKLGGCDVLDKVTGAKKTTPTDEIVRLTDETDRIYYKAPPSVEICQEDVGEKLTITQTGFTDWIVWNAWEKKQKTMADLHDWKTYVCVEAGLVEENMNLKPGSNWSASQTFRSSKL